MIMPGDLGRRWTRLWTSQSLSLPLSHLDLSQQWAEYKLVVRFDVYVYYGSRKSGCFALSQIEPISEAIQYGRKLCMLIQLPHIIKVTHVFFSGDDFSIRVRLKKSSDLLPSISSYSSNSQVKVSKVSG